jgi:hypothetical protein
MEVLEANGEKVRASWKSLDEFGEGRSILYPTGLLEMLTEIKNDRHFQNDSHFVFT